MPQIDLTGLLTAKAHRRYSEFRKIRQELTNSSAKARNFYELILADLISTLVKPGDTVVDVGANAGKHTFNFLRALNGRGKCISIEPNPRMAQTIGARLRNHKNSNMCELLNVAASDRGSIMLPFHVVPTIPALSRFDPSADFLSQHQTEIINVPVLRLDDVASVNDRISFIKSMWKDTKSTCYAVPQMCCEIAGHSCSSSAT